MNWRLHLVDWLAVSLGRTIQIAWLFWVLLALSAYFDWGGPKGWTTFVIPLSWLTLLAFVVMLALRKNELSSKVD